MSDDLEGLKRAMERNRVWTDPCFQPTTAAGVNERLSANAIKQVGVSRPVSSYAGAGSTGVYPAGGVSTSGATDLGRGWIWIFLIPMLIGVVGGYAYAPEVSRDLPPWIVAVLGGIAGAFSPVVLFKVLEVVFEVVVKIFQAALVLGAIVLVFGIVDFVTT